MNFLSMHGHSFSFTLLTVGNPKSYSALESWANYRSSDWGPWACLLCNHKFLLRTFHPFPCNWDVYRSDPWNHQQNLFRAPKFRFHSSRVVKVLLKIDLIQHFFLLSLSHSSHSPTAWTTSQHNKPTRTLLLIWRFWIKIRISIFSSAMNRH